MQYEPPTPEERRLVEECYAIQYPDNRTWPLTPGSAKRAILAELRSVPEPAAQDNGEWQRHRDFFS